jgi:hypothetical protein
MMGVALRGAAEGGFAVCFLQQGSWQVPHRVCKRLHAWPWELRINRGLKEVYMGQIEQQYPTSISHLCARWLVSASASSFLSPLTHSHACWLFLAPAGLHLSPQAFT